MPLSRETYKRLFVEYKEDPEVRNLFAGNPYITQHMNAKDRNEYNSYKKGKTDKIEKKPMVPPQMGYNMHQMLPMNYNMPPGRYPMNGPGYYQPM